MLLDVDLLVFGLDRSSGLAVPCSIFSCSAAIRLVLSPIATSLVTLLPPSGSTAV